jgi:hypothetical protein
MIWRAFATDAATLKERLRPPQSTRSPAQATKLAPLPHDGHFYLRLAVLRDTQRQVKSRSTEKKITSIFSSNIRRRSNRAIVNRLKGLSTRCPRAERLCEVVSKLWLPVSVIDRHRELSMRSRHDTFLDDLDTLQRVGAIFEDRRMASLLPSLRLSFDMVTMVPRVAGL